MLLPVWALTAVVYAVILALAALTQSLPRRGLTLTAVAAYGLAAVAVGTVGDTLGVALAAPGALLLCGYWLSGAFFRKPQPWLEAWLLRVDRAVAADRWLSRLPRTLQEALELSYALVYVVVGGGAIYAATRGTDTVTAYWSLVLAAELASFAPLPWLRSRPPRVVEVPGTHWSQKPHNCTQILRSEGARHPDDAVSALMFRKLNTWILEAASVQANTLPSGHVAGAVAVALAVSRFDATGGAVLMGMAGLIAVAAIAGRYHYVVDCVAGAMVAFAFSSLM